MEPFIKYKVLNARGVSGCRPWMVKHIIKSFTHATNVNIFETLKFETKCFRRLRVKNIVGEGDVLIFFFSPFWHNFTSAWFYYCSWLVIFIAQQLMKKYPSDLGWLRYLYLPDSWWLLNKRKQGGHSWFSKISNRSFVPCLISEVFSDIWVQKLA